MSLCKCGCGNEAKPGNDYIKGHNLVVINKGKRDKKNAKIDKFIADNKGTHFCHCGCNEEIIITRSHYHDGIPKYIHGHYIRVNHPMKRPEIAVKMCGDNNPMKRPEVAKKLSKILKEIMPGVMARPEVKKNQLDGVRAWHKNNPEQSKINAAKSAIISCQSQDGKPSSIELKTIKLLTDNNYRFETQVPLLNMCIPDIVFQKEKVIIQCDGDYWHNYPYGLEKDYEQDKILKKNGWQVIRFWEHEINDDIKWCLEKFEWETFGRFYD